MSEPPPELDEALQARLSALAGAASPRLDELGRRRVLSTVRREAAHAAREGRLAALADEASPSLDAAARRRVLASVRSAVERPRPRRRWIAVAATGALAAAALLVVALGEDGAHVDAARVAERACDDWEAPAEGIGRRGQLTVSGQLRVESPDGCTSELHLVRGEVEVHARDLGGGVLRVHAGPATVEVRGTRFTVARTAAHVSVAVTEGHVVVTVGDEPQLHLRAGDAWERRATEMVAGDLEAADESVTDGVVRAEVVADGAATDAARTGAAVLAPPTAAVGARRRPRAPAVVEAPEGGPTPAAELGRAEALWRQGQRDEARASFRRVGRGRDAIAEAAWVRLARNELRAGDAAAARTATREHGRRFARGRLRAEALWLEAQASERLGDAAGAARARAALQRREPGSPQARAAESAE